MFDPLFWMVPFNTKYDGNIHKNLWFQLSLSLGKDKTHRFVVDISDNLWCYYRHNRHPVYHWWVVIPITNPPPPPILVYPHGHTGSLFCASLMGAYFSWTIRCTWWFFSLLSPSLWLDYSACHILVYLFLSSPPP